MSDMLILGSAGFVGSNLTNYTIQHSKQTIASIDDLSLVPDCRNLQLAIKSRARHTFYLAEAENAVIIEKIFRLEKPKTVIFNIASTHLNAIEEGRLSYVKAASCLITWLDLAYLHGVDKFIILCGSVNMYHSLNTSALQYIEACDSAPLMYANKLKVCNIKSCEIFGPRQNPNSEIPKIFINALENKTTVTSDKRMDLVYIKDFFNTFSSFLNNDFEIGTYVIRGIESISLKEIYNLAVNLIAGNPISISTVHNTMKLPETSFEQRLLSWTPKHDVISALEHTLCWYDANRWAWRLNA